MLNKEQKKLMANWSQEDGAETAIRHAKAADQDAPTALVIDSTYAKLVIVHASYAEDYVWFPSLLCSPLSLVVRAGPGISCRQQSPGKAPG